MLKLGQVRCGLMTVVGRVVLHRHGIQFGSGLTMSSMPICKRNSNAVISLGRNVTIRNTLHENMAGISHPTVLAAVAADAHLEVGNNVGISGAILYCVKRIIIEDFVNIGAGAKVYDTDFHPIQATARRTHDISQIKSAPVRIMQDAWLGAESLILKGVTVGARSIIAARAVVVKDVPDDCIVAGVPARIVARFHAGQISSLNELRHEN